jgi:integrase
MKFPKTIVHRGFKVKIYGKTPANRGYRLDYRCAGERQQRSFKTYSAALKKANAVVRDLAKGSQAAILTAAQSRDFLAASEQLQGFYQSRGQRVSLLAAVSQFVDASTKLHGHTLNDAIDGFLRNVASVKRKDIKKAVEDFVKVDEPLTKAAEGKRSQRSSKHAYNREHQLQRFAGMFPNFAVCDLDKDLINSFFKSLSLSPKTRNHYRTSVRQFIRWAAKNDYLPEKHRLMDADQLRLEHADPPDPLFYTPDEFTELLKAADDYLRPIIAIGGLAGLRTEELLRLDWADVWHVDGHIEVSSRIAKGRFRRLVDIYPALAAWLNPFRKNIKGKLWIKTESKFQKSFLAVCNNINIDRKQNGLRHAFCTYHYARYSDDGETAKLSGNSPAMIHSNYKGLATKVDAEKWFAVIPPVASNDGTDNNTTTSNAPKT